MQRTDRTFNFVISNSLTSLQTTMQTNLNLEMEKLQRRKSRADEIRTVGYKSFEFSASISKKNRIFWDMGMDRKMARPWLSRDERLFTGQRFPFNGYT